MVNVRQPRDIAQVLLSVLFLAIMIVACLWIVQPFILGFAWAGTIVIATWPVLLKLQKNIVGPPLACRTGHDAAVSAALRYFPSPCW
ncbi:putative inner membrane protein [Salmonella enterica subsp. enterica]|uniref:Putative inner membrane protein n=1 Tax=Salmonella enterica I TaxID=59201 RepID=A0A447U499_SALET|nr:putative inner membrane protein [Salmonella enterica subsp. enterica]